MTRRWYIRVEAFGHVLATHYTAATEAEAIAKAHERVGYRIEVTPPDDLPEPGSLPDDWQPER